MTQRHFKVILLHKSFDTDVTRIATAEARRRNIRRSHANTSWETLCVYVCVVCLCVKCMSVCGMYVWL